MQSSQPEVPQLPDEIIISILFDYYPPNGILVWSINILIPDYFMNRKH